MKKPILHPERALESRAKFAGHPLHPMLIVFPLGLLFSVIVLDILHLVTGSALYAQAAAVNLALGILGGLAAAVPGLRDWLALPPGTRAKRVGAAHAAGNLVGLMLFAMSGWVRWNTPDWLPATAALILAFVGAAALAITGWLGGELVDRMGVGVDRGAHLNSPSSLSGQLASQRAAQRLRAQDEHRVP